MALATWAHQFFGHYIDRHNATRFTKVWDAAVLVMREHATAEAALGAKTARADGGNVRAHLSISASELEGLLRIIFSFYVLAQRLALQIFLQWPQSLRVLQNFRIQLLSPLPRLSHLDCRLVQKLCPTPVFLASLGYSWSCNRSRSIQTRKLATWTPQECILTSCHTFWLSTPKLATERLMRRW